MMLLFNEDWSRYSDAIIHTNTKNTSFLRLAALYKKMGIRNHAFLLALLNPKLRNVDPFNPYLTMDEMIAIGIECRMNIWYYLREVARAPALAGSEDTMFLANRGNISVIWLFMNHIPNILIQIRQTGKTFTLKTLCNYLLEIGGQNTDMVLLTKDDSLRATTLDGIRDVESTLPPYLLRRLKTDISNTAEIQISQLKNSLKAVVSSLSEKAALKVGRGFTSPIFIIDETAFIPNIRIALPAALAAGGAARDMAKINGSFYGTILSTTAGKLDDRDGKYVFDLLTNAFPFSEKLFDCQNEKDLESLIRKNNKDVLWVNSTFSHRQLGYSDEWLKRKIEEAVADGEDAERDFLNKWTSGNIRSPLSPEILDMIKQSRIEVVFTEITDKGYILNWYIEENMIDSELNMKPAVLGLDSSDASGGDDIAMVIMSVNTGKVLCSATFNETNIIDFCMWFVSLLCKYQKVTAIIERRSTGSVIIDYLLKMLPNYNEDPYKRLFNRIIQDREEDIDKFKAALMPLSRKDATMLVNDKKYFGFATSSSGLTSRSELYGITLADCAKKTGKYTYDAKLIGEITGLVIKNGRVDHDTGNHDDLVIAWVLAYWLMSRGQNIDVYGIDPSTVLLENRLSALNGTINQYDLDNDVRIKKEIDIILEKTRNTQDDNMIYMYEKQIRYLTTQIRNKEYLSTLSIDDLLNKIKEQKRMNNKNNSLYYQTPFDFTRPRPQYETNSYFWGNRKI